MSEDLAAWLRPKIEAELSRWRGLEAAYLPNVEREGEVLWWEARDHADQLESHLAILDQHKHVPTRTGFYGTPFDFGCTTCHEMSDPEGNSDVRADGWCETIRWLGYGYRHWLKYRDPEWVPYLVELARRGDL